MRKWRGRFAERGLAGLEDLPRSGRPRRISEADRAAVVALACQLPAETGVPLSRWTGPELARELAAQGLVSAPVSATSLLRILAENASTPKTTGIVPFMGLVGQVMERPEYRDAPRAFVIVDNGSDHRGKAAIDRLRKAHPNAIMIHTRSTRPG